jgi:histidinol phosphatase-like PHP family hydrolase
MDHWPRTDLHLHATRYRLTGARPEMTVANIVGRLKDKGYVTAGIVEHLDTHRKHPLSCLENLVSEFRTVEREHPGVRDGSLALYVGAELDYQGDLDGQGGGISIPDALAIRERLGLDYLLAGVHGLSEGVTSAQTYVEDHHRRLMGIAACPYVDVVVHPWCGGHSYARRGRIEAWRFECIPEQYLVAFVDAAAQSGKAIEINAKVQADAGDPAFQRYLELLRESGVRVTVGSDAHDIERVGNVDPLNALLREAGFGPDRLWRPGR